MSEKRALVKKNVVNAALKSGIVNPKTSMEELIKKFEDPIGQVAGYVLAWDKYVLVVGLPDFEEEEISVIKRQR